MARQVYVVGSDGDYLKLATRPDGPAAYLLRRTDVPAADDTRPPVDGPAAGPPLSPREIQARLRAGETVDEVSAAAGMPVARVQAYAAPVLGELSRVLDDARAAVMSRPFAGPSRHALGAAVAERWAAVVGQGDPRQAAWSARRERDGSWLVAVDVGQGVRATWRWDRAHRSLVPLDDVAAALGFVPPSAAAARVAADAPPLPGDATAPTAATPAPSPTARSSPAGSTGRSRRAAVPAWSDVLMGVSGDDEPTGPTAGRP